MILHLVLFRPRAGLDGDARQGLADAFATALRDIGSITRARIGRRRILGHGYEQSMTENYTHVAILEFESQEGLQSYLGHPAHQELASRFFACFEQALMYDFELGEGHAGLDALVEEDQEAERAGS